MQLNADEHILNIFIIARKFVKKSTILQYMLYLFKSFALYFLKFYDYTTDFGHQHQT